MWVREYVFNVIIQPFHLLIYTVLVGSSVELVADNMIYGIVAIGFLVPAEKLLRKFFGFDNAGTLSAAGSFAGGAVFSSIVNKLNKHQGGRNDSDDDSSKNRGIRKASSNGIDADEILIGKANGGASGSANKAIEPTQNADQRNSQKSAGDKTSQTSQSKTPEPRSPSKQQESGQQKNNTNNEKTHDNQNPDNSGQPKPNNESEPESTEWKENRGLGMARVWEDVKGGWKKEEGIRSNLSAVSHVVGNAAKSGLSRGVDAGNAVVDRYKRKILNAARPSRVVKKVGRWTRRATIGGLAGGALGITGLAVGVASGDPSKAATLAGAAGLAGYHGANYYGDKFAKEVGEAAKDATVGFWGEDYGKRQQYLYDKNFKKDPSNLRVLQKYLGAEGAREAMKTRVQPFLNAGISDPKVIGKALQLMDNPKNEEFFGKRYERRR